MRVFILLLTLVGALQAYTDPGTGIMLWQIMLAVLAGLSFRFRAIVARFFSKKEQSGELRPPVENDRT